MMKIRLSLKAKLILAFLAILVFSMIVVLFSTRFALLQHFQHTWKQYGNEMGMGGPRFLTTVNWSLFIVGSAGTALAFILGYFFSQSFLRPIKEIISKTKSIASGNYKARIKIKTNDEMDELVDSLNHMFESLEKIENLRRDLTANMSHELLTPLTNIYGYLEALQDGIIKDEEQKRKTIDIIKEEAEKLIATIKESKKLSLLESENISLNLKKADINKLLEKIIGRFKFDMKTKAIKINKGLDKSLPLIRIDQLLIEQALSNILKNAIKYSHKNGTIELKTKIEKDYLKISVKDYGKGIRKEDMPFIFERFYRGDKSRHDDGIGIGLTMAQQIIKIHKGKIEVSSNFSQGSIFTVYLLLNL